MWLNQPVRYEFVIEYTTKVGNDHTERLSDATGVELEGEVDLFEPGSAYSQEVGALHYLPAVDGHAVRNLPPCKEMADQHRPLYNPVPVHGHAVAARLRISSAVACPISSWETSPVFHVMSYSPGSATSTPNLSMIIL